jgi:Xaa-Pro aminopeptidase
MGVSSGPHAHTYGPSGPSPYEGRRRLAVGDMFRLDLYGSVDGYCFDFGRSRVVGAEPSAAQAAVLDAARDPVLAGVDRVRPGATLGDVARACDAALAETVWAREGRGLPPGLAAWGHAVGNALEPPFIVAGSEQPILPGMCLAVERRIVSPGVGGATYEENVLVGEDGASLLTTSRDWSR